MDTTFESTALTIAEDVRSGRRTALDVTREHLARISSFDPELNAFAAVRHDGALADAAAVDATSDRSGLPLAGVPVAIKDNMAITGLPVRHGSASTSPEPATADDELVARLRRAGAIVVGTTRMPEFAAWAFTSSTAYGPSRNPYDPTRDPGGSSGGAAAAVAAGMAAAAVGTDGGGSIRVPAAHCGLVGLKPTRDLVPLPGGAAAHWHGMSVAGPIARNAADAAALLEVISDRPLTAVDPSGSRIAVSLRSPSPIGRPDKRQREAVSRAVTALRGAGYDVAGAGPRYPASVLGEWGKSWLAGVAEDVAALAVDPGALEPRTSTMAHKGRRGPGNADGWTTRADDFFSHYDLLVTPVVARGPARAGELDGKGYGATYLASARSVPLCQPWNLAGYPALAVPVGWSAGLPLSAQLVARPGSEGLLLSFAGTIQSGIG